MTSTSLLIEQPALQHLLYREILQSEIIGSSICQRFHRHQTDDFTAENIDAVSSALHPHRFKNTVYGGLAVVGEIHGHLNNAPVFQFDSHGLAVSVPSADMPDPPGDSVSDFQTVRIESDIISNQGILAPIAVTPPVG